MKKYEGVFIFAPDMAEETRNNVIDRLKSIIEGEGSLSNIDDWGSRKLAYEIDDYKEGYYTLLKFESNGEIVKELDRICKITDGVIRHMIVREEEK
ncbi:30S ribosomal protein S6 [Gottschalkia purinilytica]|uniref:Small ribosomal subunit protein bS6 n=1 Tax=Gottschalkia purinilytica TaxID=1503 RepID=A0A0L0W6L7_GOTPU|nr:30S ribosomal protein S6 [Gottschalkia purinilytica]KNF07136.1 30S ribosomal protein S6 [Gottschalkia purinilytica]